MSENAYDDYLRALDDEFAREQDTREPKPSFFTALLEASARATQRQIREANDDR